MPESHFNPNVPLVYIAGPYMGKARYHDSSEYEEIDRNISRAREAAAWLVRMSFYMVCPHLNSAHFEVIAPSVKPEHWYALDFRILSHCDAMLVVGDWASSKGTIAEMKFCIDRGIPYFFDDQEGREELIAAFPFPSGS